MTQTVTNYNDPDPLATIRGNTIGLQNPKVDEKEECSECEWRYWCTGGCPLQAHRATGRYDVKSPNCNIYKALYPEVVRLEGLRLLKYAEEIARDKVRESKVLAWAEDTLEERSEINVV